MELERAVIVPCRGRLTGSDFMLEVIVKSSEEYKLERIKSELMSLMHSIK